MFGAPFLSYSCVLIYPPIKLAMADDFATDGAVTVDNPEDGAVIELNPTKLILVTAVPTELPPNLSSTPEITSVRLAPEPTNDVAVTTPTALMPPADTLIPDRAVIIPTESILVTSSYVSVPAIDTALLNVDTPVTTIPVGNPTAPPVLPFILSTNNCDILDLSSYLSGGICDDNDTGTTLDQLS